MRSTSKTKTLVEKGSAVPARRIAPNPNAPPPPKVLTKATLDAEAKTRDALRKEFLAMQEAIRNTEILIPFIFYDGTNIPAGTVKVKKGDPVWLFLDRSRKVGADRGVGRYQVRKEIRREWVRASVDDLILVRGNIMIPHVCSHHLEIGKAPLADSLKHYEFYYFIVNKVPSFSRAGGLLFDYSSSPPPATSPEENLLTRPSNDNLEGGDKDPTLTRVVNRRWYERNKHIYPASLWCEYEPGKEFEEKMMTTRRDAKGNVFFF